MADGRDSSAVEIGQAVDITGVATEGLEVNGKRGTVTEIPGHGLISITLDGGDGVVSSWPENLKIVRGANPAPSTDSEPPAK